MQVKCPLCTSAVPTRGEPPGADVICPTCGRAVEIPVRRGFRERKKRTASKSAVQEAKPPWLIDWVLRRFGR